MIFLTTLLLMHGIANSSMIFEITFCILALIAQTKNLAMEVALFEEISFFVRAKTRISYNANINARNYRALNNINTGR